MKNVGLIAIVAIFFVGMVCVFFTSCKKSNLLIKSGVEQNVDQTVWPRPIRLGVGFAYDEWGRMSKDCKGNGLCNFHIEWVGFGLGKMAPMYQDDNGSIFTELAFDQTYPISEDNQSFPIDADISRTGVDGSEYILKAGNYPIDPHMGNYGGCKLPLIKH